MTPVEITTIVSALGVVLASVGVPVWLRHRADKQAAGESQVVSWRSITEVLQKERDAAQQRLNTSEDEYRGKIRELDADYSRQLADARQRIAQLEAERTQMKAEMADLYSQIYRQRKPPSP